MSIIREKFLYYSSTVGDIEEHMGTLLEYACECQTIVELGTRKLVSTWAFLHSYPEKLTCVDVVHPSEYGPEGRENLQVAIEECENNGIDFEFILADDLTIELPEVDMIFIDTDHTYDQLDKELKLHGNKAKKYLIFHDTNQEDMVSAIYEFLERENNWKVIEHFYNNNGLMILEKNETKTS